MNVRLEEIIVFFFVPLVVSGCSSLKLKTKNDQELCNEWWDKAFGASIYSKTRADCLLLIKKKCPDTITLSITITKKFEDSYELWTYTGIGTPSDGRYGGLCYFITEDKPVCFDDNGKVKDCDWWWGLAQNKDVKTSYRARCIDRIFRHCEYNIRVTEERPCEAQRVFSCKGGKVVTYSYGGATTTITH